MLPNFIGIGAPKAGTTWIFQCLREHPQVYVAPVKETKFFDEDTIEGRMGEYEAHFAGANGETAVGEISTRYLSSVRAPDRIRQWVPDARLFVSLRNPVDQVYSHYWHLRRQNFHQGPAAKLPDSFEDALRAYEDALVRPALYGAHLRRWLARFDGSRILVLFYDDICHDPLAVRARLYAFLGVDPDHEPVALNRRGSEERRGMSPRSPALGRAHTVLYREGNRLLYMPLKRLAGPWVAEGVKNTLKLRHVMERLFLQDGYPAMDPRTRHELERRFSPEVDALMELTGRDLSHWKGPRG